MAENLNSYADSVIEQKSDKEVADINGQISGLDTRVTALEEGGGGGGAYSPFICEVLYKSSDNSFTFSETFANVMSAVLAGKTAIKLFKSLWGGLKSKEFAVLYLIEADNETTNEKYVRFAMTGRNRYEEDSTTYTSEIAYFVTYYEDGTSSGSAINDVIENE